MNDIKADNLSIKTFIDKWEKIEIPNFQRKYVWDKKEITDFLDSIITSDEGYYIGTIVSIPSHGKSEAQIIDGQQRITTLSLVLLALRDLMYEVNIDLAELARADLEEDVQSKIRDINNLLFHKKLNNKNEIEVTSRLYFENDKNLNRYYQSITEEYTGDSLLASLKSLGQDTDLSNNSPAKLLVSNYEIIKSYIKGTLSKSENVDLIQQYKKLAELKEEIEKLVIVEIKVTSHASAFEMFEGLNSKGVQLNVSDLLRSLIFKQGTENPELIEYWERLDSIFYELPNNVFPKFLRRHWIAKNKYVSSNDLYAEVKDKVSNDRNFALTFTQTVTDDAKFYFAIINNNVDELKSYLPKNNEDIYPYFSRFRLLNNDQIYEVLIAIKDKISKIDKIKSDQIKEMLFNFWTVAFRSSYQLVSPSKFERKFATYCQVIRKLDYVEFIQYSRKFIKDELRPLVSDRATFISTISEYDFTKNQKIATFILSEFVYNKENRAKDFEGFMAKITEGNTSVYTLEHILPKEPLKHWGFYKKQIDHILQRLGNFSFLTPNQNYDAGNLSFKEKYQIYSKTGFEHHKKLIEWEPGFEGSLKDVEHTITTRGIKLAEQLEKFYNVD